MAAAEHLANLYFATGMGLMALGMHMDEVTDSILRNHRDLCTRHSERAAVVMLYISTVIVTVGMALFWPVVVLAGIAAKRGG